MSGSLGFQASNTHLATSNPKFQTEIEPDCAKTFFFCLHLCSGAKLWTDIELLSLTKLRKNLSPLRNLLNQQNIDTYAHYTTSAIKAG